MSNTADTTAAPRRLAAAKNGQQADGRPAARLPTARDGEGLTSPRPPGRCPSCGTALDGGPVLYRCATCARAVYAADLDVEYRPADPETETA
jgi:DNA-directed RNA polymerase subunit RPC12/RpoP